jgi:microcystin-dependent protein
MSAGDAFLSEIKLVSFDFAPKGWAQCNGQILPINQNQALFAILGTTYGGNGISTFALPDLRGRVPVHVGNNIVLGQHGGEESHTLTIPEMAAHTHQASGTTSIADKTTPVGNTWATSNDLPFGTGSDATMAAVSLANTGGSQPHNNLQPYAAVNFIIALQGIFPSRN